MYCSPRFRHNHNQHHPFFPHPFFHAPHHHHGSWNSSNAWRNHRHCGPAFHPLHALMFFAALAMKGFLFLVAVKIVGLILSILFSPVMLLIGLAALTMPSCGGEPQQSSRSRRCGSSCHKSSNDESEQLRRFFSSMWNIEEDVSTETAETTNTSVSPSTSDANVDANSNADETPSSANTNKSSRQLNVPAHKTVSDDKMVLTFDLPGFALESINIQFDPETGVLSIEGTRTNRLGDSFTVDQKFPLDSEEFNVDEIEALMSEGVLEVTVPKNPKPEARVISISSTKKVD